MSDVSEKFRSRCLFGSISHLPLGEYRLSIIANGGSFIPPLNSTAVAVGDGSHLAVIWRNDGGPLEPPSQPSGE
jgi:hypothetical protein